MKRAVELARERADLRDGLGTILAQRNQFADAEASFAEALRLQQNLEQAHFLLGVAHLQGQPPLRNSARPSVRSRTTRRFIIS